MALYKGETLLAGSGAGFNPENEGTTGQLLTKTETGYRWDDLAEGGEEGQVLMKTEDGYAWCDAPGGVKYANIDILVVGGGGAGGKSSHSIGGGGGGGFLECPGYLINSECLEVPIVVGAGGAAVNGCSGCKGGNSCAYTLIGYGGGGGGGCNGYPSNGGSGGGDVNYNMARGAGKGTCGQGNDGGSALGCGGGGGGGAGAAGGASPAVCKGGDGGDGKCSCISGECLRYSGGGAGHGYSSGDGVDGQGSASSGCYGGGGRFNNSGCQGIVIIRYKTDGSCGIKNTSYGGCKYTCGDYTIHCFTTLGTDYFKPVFK